MKNKTMAIFTAIALCFTLTTITVSAETTNAGVDEDMLISGNEIEDPNLITVEELEAEKSRAMMTRATVEIKTIVNYSNFTWRHSKEFNQYYQGNTNTNCVPTAMTNIFDYYSKARGLNMYSGQITQAMYNQLCTDVGWQSSGPEAGTYWSKQEPGFKTFANRYGRNATVDTYWFNLWSDVTRDISANKPIMVSIDGHMYVAIGYKDDNGSRSIICLTNYEDYLQYIPFANIAKMQSVVIY